MESGGLPLRVEQGLLTKQEYDETTWAARNFRTFAKQRISCAAHKAAAQEIRDALGLASATDPRGAA